MDENVLKITKRSHSYKDSLSTHSVKILNSFSSELQVKYTKFAVKYKPIDLLSKLREFKFVTTLDFEFETTESYVKAIYSTFLSNSKVETIIMENNIADLFEKIYNTIILNIQRSKVQW